MACGRSAPAVAADSGRQTMTARLGVAEEVRELALLIAGVERQVDEAGAQAREIERERFPAFLDLHGDAVAADATGIGQRVRKARGRGVELIVVDHRPVRDEQAGLAGALVEMRAEQGVQVGVHASGAATAAITAQRPRGRVAAGRASSSAVAGGQISPAPRAHLYFAPSTITGISVEYG